MRVVRWSYAIPVLSGHDPEEHGHGVQRGLEVGLPVDSLPELDRAEEDHADERVARDEQEHAWNKSKKSKFEN